MMPDVSGIEDYDGEVRRSQNPRRDLESIRRLSYGLPPELRCVECGATAEGSARGWRALLTVDDETAVYCGDCAREEFGDG